jgi:hypothetical protein
MPIQIGVSDPAQFVQFILAAEQATGSSRFASFASHKALIKARTGVDVDAAIAQLTGTLIAESDTHTTLVRAGVANGTTASTMLGKLLSDPAATLGSGSSARSIGGGFYSVTAKHQTETVGVVGSQLVAGNASAAALRAFASAPTSSVPGTQGSVAFRIALAGLLSKAAGLAGGTTSELLGTVSASLGDLTGWGRATAGALTGAASLSVK